MRSNAAPLALDSRLNALRATANGPLVLDRDIDVNRPEILALIQETHAELGLKQEAAAAIAGVKPSQYSAALNGRGNFAATWLWAQDDTFILKLLDKVMDARGLTPQSASAVRRQRIVELIDLLLRECA